MDMATIELLVSGGMAGAAAKTLVAPIDRVKILYQVNADRAFTFHRGMKTLDKIMRNSGVAGLWRGNGAALMRVVPYSSVVFCTFDITEQRLVEGLGREKDVYSRLAAGAVAGLTATTITYPFDLIRARMAAHWSLTPRYSGYFSGLKEIVQTEGRGALFLGLKPTLLGIVPYAGLSFAMFETSKAKATAAMGLHSDSQLSFLTRAALGGFSGVIAQTVTYPLHVVRRRMQVSGSSTPVYSSVAQALTEIYKREGICAGWFKGLSLTLIKGPVALGISFALNDVLKTFMGHNNNRAPIPLNSNRDRAPIPLTCAPTIDISSEAPKDKRQLTTFESLLAGGLAGATAKTVIAPGDRVKILYQVNPDRPFSLLHACRTARTIVSNSGVSGLWRGHGATLLRVVPYSATSFVMFERYEKVVRKSLAIDDHSDAGRFSSRFIAGSMAGATAVILTYPLDLMRARMAAQWSIAPAYEGYYGALKSIVATEGPLALFQGLTPTLLGIVPYAGISFALFETSKSYVKRRYLEPSQELDQITRLSLGMSAGLVAQSLTYPLDIVRRRLQVQRSQPSADHPSSRPHYKSVSDAFVTIYRTEGLANGLFKGLAMNWIKGPIATGVSFTVNDNLKTLFQQNGE